MSRDKPSLTELVLRYKHDTLKRDLAHYANEIGYNTEVKLESGQRPDVLFLNDNGEMFLGDAKDAENETISNRETTKRIAGYIDSFFEYKEMNNKSLGYISIITNDLDAAYDWQDWLNDYCLTKAMMNFEIERSSRGAFVIINEWGTGRLKI